MHFAKLFGAQTAVDLLAYPNSLVAPAILFLVALPLVALLLGYDSISAGVETGTLAFWRTRVTVGQLVAGKFLALWASICVLPLASLTLVCLATTMADGLAAVPLLTAMRFMSICAVAALPYAAMSLFASSAGGRPANSLMLGAMLAIAFCLLGALARVYPSARWFLPAEDALLLRRSAAAFGEATGLVVVWTLGCLALSTGALARRSI